MKIALFGGAFDPLHKEHIRLIEMAKEVLGVDKVLLMPSYNPPHKNSLATPYEHRVNMLKLYAGETSKVFIDETEKSLNLEKSYAYIVLQKIKEKYPGDELYYVIGSDSLIKFETWAKPEVVASLVKIRVARRSLDHDVEGYCEKLNALYEGADFKFLCDAKEESSSELKLDLELKRYDRLNGRIYPKILDYIKNNNLYSNYGAIIDKLKAEQSDVLFNHSIRTAEFCVKNAWRVWESFDRAFVAGLLHDCAKERAPLKELKEYPTNSKSVAHQYDGATVAEAEYGITDEGVLDAIRYHTTAKPNFSKLGKLLYLADKLESGRNYEGIEDLRKGVEQDFDKGFIAVLNNGVEYLNAKGVQYDVLTLEAYKWYN
ncbi:MAG: nicotinate (nicotinamide) nucleotide adenylyltransferase [Clostridia bacterium]|nr:nicotinate (nicotinamide) nucleotide adenylyltransferase [Clostridia bacterium]